jgi:hypothetical protein
MPDQKISELAAITTIDNAADVLPIVDTSATTTKKVTPTQLKTSLALNNVDNTSDANKPVSSATQTALDAKQATLVSGTNIKTVNNTSLLGSGNITIAGGGGTWGSITGTLSNQTDLQTALDGKVDENTAITGATKTKVTYDAKGLVTAGADATTADIASSTDKRYVTDAQLVVVGNTSGTNTGDNATNSQYSGLAASKQDTLVSGTNIKTINSTSLLGSGNVAVEPTITATTSADYYRGDKTFATLNKAAVGLGNVDNTSDTNKPVSTATQTALDGKQAALGFTAENVANKSTSVTTDQASNTKYPSVKAVYDWAVGLFATIANLALKTDKLVVANRQTASYTLVLSDADKLVEMNVGSANNLTVPLNSSVAFSTGTQILLAQYGAGQTTIVATSGVTIRSNGAKLKLNAQYSGATLVKIGENEWYLFGDIAS